jgi:hypothetical protein
MTIFSHVIIQDESIPMSLSFTKKKSIFQIVSQYNIANYGFFLKKMFFITDGKEAEAWVHNS